MSTVAFVAMCALVIATPFETRQAVFALPYQQLTFTELVWLVAAIVFVAACVVRRQAPIWRTPVTAPWLAWMALMMLAAVFADADRANAVKTTARLIVFGLTGLMVATSVTNARRMALVLSMAAAAGLVVALLAMLEVWGVAPVVSGLDAFRDGVRVVGGQVRASSTLQYPTITAMYLEIVLCGALGVLLWAVDRRNWRTTAAACAGLFGISAGLSLTLTRAAVLAALCGLSLAAWWRYRQRGPELGFALVVACAVCIAGAPVLLGSWEVSRARWTTDGRLGWYRAAFDAPQKISGRPGELVHVPVTVTNQGKITWSPDVVPPFHLSYHWVDAVTARVVRFDGVRTTLQSDVPPGARLDQSAQVRFPRTPGAYRVAWDVVQEGRLWFVAEPGAQTTFTSATVAGEPSAHAYPEPPSSRRSPAFLPAPVVIPARPALWNAAMRMTAGHPWLGVGPDNFRLRYGGYLRVPDPDTRVHSNNLYLEVLTGGGVFAAAAFVWFLWRLAAVVNAQHNRLTGAAATVYTGVAAAGVAYLTHGCLDSFLTFTPTAFASAVILGLAIAPAQWAESGAAEATPAQWAESGAAEATPDQWTEGGAS